MATVDLAQIATILNGILAAGPDLERLGSLASVETEAKARIARLQSDEATIYKSLVTRARGEVAEEWNAESRAKATLEADAIKADALKQVADLQEQIKELQRRASQLQVANDATADRLKKVHEVFKAAG